MHKLDCRLTQGSARWLCVHEGRYLYPPLWGFPEPGDRKEWGRKPQLPRPRAHCAHAYTLSWQRPPWGEASTCPIPEQGAGVVARPQPGRPDSGERNEGGGHSCPGGLTQELKPSRSDLVPPPHTCSSFRLCRWPAQEPGFMVIRGSKSQPLAVPVDNQGPRGQSLSMGTGPRARRFYS